MSTISPEWQARIDEAQDITHEHCGGKLRARVPHGAGANAINQLEYCGDCGVAIGQLHVITCDVECCPACGGQALGCDCYDESLEQ